MWAGYECLPFSSDILLGNFAPHCCRSQIVILSEQSDCCWVCGMVVWDDLLEYAMVTVLSVVASSFGMSSSCFLEADGRGESGQVLIKSFLLYLSFDGRIRIAPESTRADRYSRLLFLGFTITQTNCSGLSFNK